MSQGDFPRPRNHPAANEPSVRNRMMWGAIGARSYQTCASIEHSGNAVDLRRFQSLLKLNGGRMVGIRLASMVLPEPGGPIIRMLWPPAQATSIARLAVCCPRTSLKSMKNCCDCLSSESPSALMGTMPLPEFTKWITSSKERTG